MVGKKKLESGNSIEKIENYNLQKQTNTIELI